MNESKDTKSIAGAQRQNRRLILWLVCGGYLLYLAFQLGGSLIAGEVPAGTETLVAWCSCIVFGLIGLALLALSARIAFRSFKGSMEAMDEMEKEAGSAEAARQEDGES